MTNSEYHFCSPANATSNLTAPVANSALSALTTSTLSAARKYLRISKVKYFEKLLSILSALTTSPSEQNLQS